MKTAIEKFRIIRPFIEDGIPLARIAADEHVSERTLRRWVALYRLDGLQKLERSGRSDMGIRRAISAHHEDIVKAFALQRPPLPMKTIYRNVVEIMRQENVKPPSYSVIRDIIRRIEPALLALAHKGEKVYSERFDLIHRREASGPNALWQADHTLLDILVSDENGEGKRPWLTIIIDDYSRAIPGFFLSFQAPSAWQTALALHQAISRKTEAVWMVCGIPQILYTDNGGDFISTHIEQVCADLKIRAVFSQPGKPRGRGRIERFFSTVNQEFLSRLPGYMPAGTVAPKRMLAISDLEEAFQQFILNDYHLRPHSVTGVSPVTRWCENGFLPHMPESPEQLDLLLLTVNTPRKVHQDGIRFQTLRYIDTTLAAFVGELVDIRYDPRDLAEIRVYRKGNFLCRAICQELAGETVSLKDITKARNERRQNLRQTLKKHRSLMDSLLNTRHTKTAVEPLSSRENGDTPTAPKRKLKLYAQE